VSVEFFTYNIKFYFELHEFEILKHRKTRYPNFPSLTDITTAISVHRLYEPGRGPQFALGGPVPPRRRSGKKFCTQSGYCTISNGIFKFNFLSVVVSEILGGPKFTLGGPAPPRRP